MNPPNYLFSRRKFLQYTSNLAILLTLGCKQKIPVISRAKVSVQKPLIFAQITDTHVGYPAVDETLLRQIVDALNEYQLDFVIHTGDVAHFDCLPEWRIFQKAFRSLRHPLFAIPGNHDTGKLPTLESCSLWREYMGPENFCFVESQVAFIGVNLTPFWQLDWKNTEGQSRMRKDILSWLEEQLQKTAECKARFVFGHFPIYFTHLDDSSYRNSISEHEVRRQILNVFVRGDCTAYFCGHTHFGWQNFLSLDGKKRIRQVAIAPLAYPALIEGYLDHKFLREKNCLGWHLWKFHLEVQILEYEFMQVASKAETIVFPA